MYLGIELGSTRIKAVAIDKNFVPVASGGYTWVSTLRDGIWTYDLDEVWKGLRAAVAELAEAGVVNVAADAGAMNEIADAGAMNVAADAGEALMIDAMGVSAMMHGYLAFDKDWNLLVPFRTWQNTITGEAAEKLSALFNFNIPQRWSIAHLYQAMLNGEEHLNNLAHITTLAGYVHFKLTGVNAVGIGEASGMFPVLRQGNGTADVSCQDDGIFQTEYVGYNLDMLKKFNEIIESYGYSWRLEDVLPDVLLAGEEAGRLTEEGYRLLGWPCPGIPFAPCEGDAGTGMAATNSVEPGTGNVSAGTSIFSMVVLEKPIEHHHPEIDVVATPDGVPVAMVHCNNCTQDTNAWVSLLGETLGLFGLTPDMGELYSKLYLKSLEGDADCGGVTTCNYVAGEGVTHFDRGMPLVMRRPDANFNLANFMRSQLYASISTLSIGMDILADEGVKVKSMTAHGGLFKTQGVAQKYFAAACGAPVTCMETASEGGAYGMAVLAGYMYERNYKIKYMYENCHIEEKKTVTQLKHTSKEVILTKSTVNNLVSSENSCVKHESNFVKGESNYENHEFSLADFLKTRVFAAAKSRTALPDKETAEGFRKHLPAFKKTLTIEKILSTLSEDGAFTI